VGLLGAEDLVDDNGAALTVNLYLSAHVLIANAWGRRVEGTRHGDTGNVRTNLRLF